MEKRDRGAAVCLGFFDGVHLGHRALLSAAREIARREGLSVCAHTFDVPPGGKGAPLTTLEERIALRREAGADTVAVSPFDDGMRRMPGDEFFRRIVLDELNARHVICGDDHRFGYRGAWGAEELRALCGEAGIGLTVVPPVTLPDGSRISTTALRAALQAGDFARAEEMLGRPVPDALRRRFPSDEILNK